MSTLDWSGVPGPVRAYLWTRHTAGSWSWVRQLGTTSLLVYWVHIELVYGRWLGTSEGTLTVGQTVGAAAVLIVGMVGLSLARSNWGRVREYVGEMRWRVMARPGAAEGD